MMLKTNVFYFILFLILANPSFAQNLTKVFVAENTSIHVAEPSSIYISNGWIQFENTSETDALFSTPPPPPHTEQKSSLNSFKNPLKRLFNNKSQAGYSVHKNKKETAAKAIKPKVSAMPFGNSPYAPINTIGNNKATVAQTTPNTPQKQSFKTLKIVNNTHVFLFITTTIGIAKKPLALYPIQHRISQNLYHTTYTTRPPPC
jgi:hypothetical protein